MAMTRTDTAAVPVHRDRRRLPAGVIGVAVLALLVGLAVGRFVTFAPTAAGAPAAAPARTLADRVAELERRVAADPDDLAAWQSLGATAVQRAGESGDPAFYALAERAFDRADDIDDGAGKTLLGRGVLALSLHEFDEALEIGRRAVAALPSNAQALGIVVDAQVELGAYDDAAETLQAMLDVRPDLAALSRASYLRELTGDLDGAHAAMRQAAASGSASAFDVATVAALQGDLALAGNDTEAAAESYETALGESPGLPAADVGLARVLAIRGDVDAAIARLTAVVERAPHPAAAVLLGELQRYAGDGAAAADTDELVRSLAALQEAQGQVVDLEMALFEADRGSDPARAVELARRAYEARPDNVFTADALAWALHRAGRSEEAVPYVEQALRLGTARAQLHHHAAEVYAATGRLDAARDSLEAAVGLTPWISFGALDDAAALAQRLDVPVPAEWVRR